MGMTSGLQELMSLSTQLKASYQGHVLYCFGFPLLHPSVQLLTTVGAGKGLWLLGITSPSLPSCLPFFPPTEPCSKSLPSSLIPLLLLHHHSTSSSQTKYRHRGDLSCRRSVGDSPTIFLTAM